MQAGRLHRRSERERGCHQRDGRGGEAGQAEFQRLSRAHRLGAGAFFQRRGEAEQDRGQADDDDGGDRIGHGLGDPQDDGEGEDRQRPLTGHAELGIARQQQDDDEGDPGGGEPDRLEPEVGEESVVMLGACSARAAIVLGDGALICTRFGLLLRALLRSGAQG
ncbi:hypothetical protein JOD53_002377 [Brevibacterium luteolum]|nr:hypothetical protein [Brevibacterium luteolum]